MSSARGAMAGREDLSPIHCAGSMGMEGIDASPTAAPLDAFLSLPRRRRIPEAAVITRPAQHLEMPFSRRRDAGAAVFTRPSQPRGGADKVANA